MSHGMSRWKTVAVAVLAATFVVLGVNLTGSAAPAASPVPTGRLESCVLDASSSCTKAHGLGVKPSAVVVQETAPGQNAVVTSVTATSYRLKWNWHDGKTFAAGTTMKFYVHFDVSGVDPSPTPSPTPTATVPTTPPTTVPPAGNVCTSPTFTTTSTDNIGDGQDFGGYFVHNNMWNNSNGTYTLGACNYDSWYVTAKQPKPADNGVQTYPNVHKDYADVPIGKIQSVRFAYTTPADCTGCVYDVAVDAWLGPDLENELMIWTENKAQSPAGVNVGVVTFAGQTYDVWHETGYTAYVSRVTQRSGVLPMASFLADMVARGWVPKPTTWQVDFGVEVVSTANVARRFDFTDFEITEN